MSDNTSLWCTERGFCRSSQLDKLAEQPASRHHCCLSRTEKCGIHLAGCAHRQKAAEWFIIKNWVIITQKPESRFLASIERRV
jgi:hypothetical protein